MDFLFSLWSYLLLTAPYLMLGLLMAGLVHTFISVDKVQEHLGEGSRFAIIKASLFGIPLPLCSCSVIPTAIALRKKGASGAATSSFLVSTPETGVDSIAVTYGMMDLPMTILRPVIAFVTALLVGVAHALFNKDFKMPEEEASPCCKKTQGGKRTILGGIRYGYFTLLEDMASWLVFGLVLGAIIDWSFPAASLSGMNDFPGRLALMCVGIVLYICASASTPIAASLILKGMSPGTAMLLLLTGPATNLSSIVVLQKYLGRKGVMINIAVIAIVSLAFSFIVDFLYEYFGWNMTVALEQHRHQHSSVFTIIITVCFLTLLFRALAKKYKLI